MRTTPLFFTTLVCVLWSYGAALAEGYAFVAARAAAPPVIDGLLNDECWTTAPRVTGFTLVSGDKAREQTEAFICCDDLALYVALRCHESNMKALKPGPAGHDAPVWSSDCVEVFLQPNRGSDRYFHFAVGAGGGMYDAIGMDPSWDAPWKAATHQDTDAWTAEIAIPFTSLDLASGATAQWGFNLCREQSALKEASSWAPMPGGFHHPEAFGQLTGLPRGLSRYFMSISLTRGEYRLGDRALAARITNQSGSPSEVVLAASITSPSGKTTDLKVPAVNIADIATKEVTLPCTLSECGSHKVTLILSDAPTGAVRARQVLAFNVPGVTVSPKDANLRTARFVRGDEVELIVVHEKWVPLDVTFTLEEFERLTRVEVVAETVKVKVEGNTFRDHFDGYQVRVYRLRGERKAAK